MASPALVAGHASLAVETRAATAEDLSAVATVFGHAFDDYRRGFDVGPDELGRLWESSLAARLDSTIVATVGGRVAGFVVFVPPGQSEHYGRRRDAARRLRLMQRAVGLRGMVRLPVLFMPMGLAYARRPARADELYISLIGVDPDLQGRGVGQALLAAAEAVARRHDAAAILLHTASSNTRARAAYERAGYELVCAVRAPWRGPAGIPAYVALRKPLRPTPLTFLGALADA